MHDHPTPDQTPDQLREAAGEFARLARALRTAEGRGERLGLVVPITFAAMAEVLEEWSAGCRAEAEALVQV